MRVLHFLPVYKPAWQYGGPVLSVSRLCEGLVQQGVEVRVITTNAGLPDFPKDKLGVLNQLNGVEVFYYPVDHQARTIFSKALVDSLPDHMGWAQLLHLSSIWQPLGLSVQKAAHSVNIPVIQTLRGALGPYSWTRSFFKKCLYFYFKEKAYLQRATLLHCTSYQEIKEISWLHLKPPTTLLPNPLDLEKLHTDPNIGNKWRRLYAIPLDTTLFIVAGRLHHKKGLDLLPKVLSQISSKPWQLVFIGDDDDGTANRLRKSFAHLGLSSRCHWLPSVSPQELAAPLNAADWLLLPSRHENFGNIVIEALACGCGVLLSDRVAVKDMLHGCPGVLVAPRTLSRWSNILFGALDIQRPSALSEKWVKDRFSQTMIAAQAKELYKSLL